MLALRKMRSWLQVIDASPSYIYNKDVPVRMARAFGSKPLKLLVMLREPIARAYSMYRRAVRVVSSAAMLDTSH